MKRESDPGDETTVGATWREVEGGVVLEIVVSGRRLNVVGRAALQALSSALELAGTRSDLRAVLISGQGRAFIGGADLRELAALDPASARTFIGLIHEVCDRCRHLPAPVLAAIGGYCLGAGLEIAASCDLRVAASDARFGMPEVRVGIPSVVEAALLPQLVGAGKAYEMMLTGRMYDASEALAMGLVQEVVAPAELEAAVDRVLQQVLASPRRALALQKRLFRRWEELTTRAAIEAGIDALAEAYEGREPGERMGEWLAARGLLPRS